MASKKTVSKKKKQTPLPRSESAAPRICTGLALIAFGVLVFLSVFGVGGQWSREVSHPT